MSQLFIGLMSGTSMDAIDCALVNFRDADFELVATHCSPYPPQTRQALLNLCSPGENEINRCGQLDREVGFLFAKACNSLLKTAGMSSTCILAIGSHGQTVRHQPLLQHPFTLQIGDPNIIAELTGITTIADFRRRDMVRGGQGAPLTPAFHHFAFSSSSKSRVVVNIGGIANLTFLPNDNKASVKGFDCGPGNTLLDEWIRRHHDQHYDRDGTWAKSGRVDDVLLRRFLEDDYCKLPYPKSTGREYYNLSWLDKKLAGVSVSPSNVQATVAQFTAHCIMDGINQDTRDSCEILLCGGGVHNKDLVERIDGLKGRHHLFTTDRFGVDPDWVEAIAFAWLARQTLNRLPGNLPAVTGAQGECVLGGIFPGG